MQADECLVCLPLVSVLSFRRFRLFSRIERETFEMSAPRKDGASTHLSYQCFSEHFSLIKDKTQEMADILVNSHSLSSSGFLSSVSQGFHLIW